MISATIYLILIDLTLSSPTYKKFMLPTVYIFSSAVLVVTVLCTTCSYLLKNGIT